MRDLHNWQPNLAGVEPERSLNQQNQKEIDTIPTTKDDILSTDLRSRYQIGQPLTSVRRVSKTKSKINDCYWLALESGLEVVKL